MYILLCFSSLVDNMTMMMTMLVRQDDIYWMIQDITSAWHLQPARHSPDYADVKMVTMKMTIMMMILMMMMMMTMMMVMKMIVL